MSSEPTVIPQANIADNRAVLPPTANTTTSSSSSAAPPNPAQSKTKTHYVVGTRKSTLALAQASLAISALRRSFPAYTFETHAISTAGDRNQLTALHQMEAKSLWTSELEELLLRGEVDLIVHSLKDVPTQLAVGCALGAACARSEKRDCVVLSKGLRGRLGSGGGGGGGGGGENTDGGAVATVNGGAASTKLSDLPDGATVGTSSVRRLAQLRRRFPRLKVADVRGNIGTRLAKLDGEWDYEKKTVRSGEDKTPQPSSLSSTPATTAQDITAATEEHSSQTSAATPEFSALVLAATGLQRIGLGDRISSMLSWNEKQPLPLSPPHSRIDSRGEQTINDKDNRGEEEGWLGPVGQGALGIEIREGDSSCETLCGAIMADGPSSPEEEPRGSGRRCWLECLVERSMLRALEGGCSVPVGVETEWMDVSNDAPGGETNDPHDDDGDAKAASRPPLGTLVVHAAVISVDGSQAVFVEERAGGGELPDEAAAEEFGLRVAKALVDKGAGEILKEITLNRKLIVEQAKGA